MNEEQAKKAINRVWYSGMIMSLIIIIIPIWRFIFKWRVSIFSMRFYRLLFSTYGQIICVLAILNLLGFGVYIFKSRICSKALFWGSVLMPIVLLVIKRARFSFITSVLIGSRVSLVSVLIYALLIYIYYIGTKATSYMHNYH